MITRASFRNFRSLREVDIDFAPLTALVGPNASGKSSVLEGLDPGYRCLPSDLTHTERGGSIDVRDGEGQISARRIMPSGRSASAASEYRYQVVQFDLAALRAHNRLKEATSLSRSGDNLTNAFASLGRAGQQRVVDVFRRLVPVFADVEARPSTDGNHRIVFQDRWTPSTWYEPERVSDGSILTFAFAVLHHQRSVVDVIGIEEPERGLHPWLLGKVIEMLRAMTTGELGDHKTQVILATQSAELLNHLQPEEVRFFTRNATTGDVEVRSAPTEERGWEHALDQYENSIGSMWLSGGLGGVPPV
jgi:predicted ATPase